MPKRKGKWQGRGIGLRLIELRIFNYTLYTEIPDGISVYAKFYYFLGKRVVENIQNTRESFSKLSTYLRRPLFAR